MNRAKTSWKKLPDKPRRILTLMLGGLLIITSGLIGWIPGPGGMIPFLLGIAVLSTEFEWAERLRDWILTTLKQSGNYLKKHPFIATVLLALTIAGIAGFMYILYTYVL